MDVETSSKKKQMFILKISWRLVCGARPHMKGNVGFECRSRSKPLRCLLSVSMKKRNESLKLTESGVTTMVWYGMVWYSNCVDNSPLGSSVQQMVKCLFFMQFDWIWPKGHHLKPTDHLAALERHRKLHISSRLEEEKLIILEELIEFPICQWVNIL